jgi:hypothetical protein
MQTRTAYFVNETAGKTHTSGQMDKGNKAQNFKPDILAYRRNFAYEIYQ